MLPAYHVEPQNQSGKLSFISPCLIWYKSTKNTGCNLTPSNTSQPGCFRWYWDVRMSYTCSPMIQPNRHFNFVWVMWWINEYCDCVLLANKRTNNRVSIGYLILLNSFSKNDFNLTNSWSSLGLGNYEVTSFELIILARPGNAPPWSRHTDFTALA